MASALDSERMTPPCTTAIANVAKNRACIIALVRVTWACVPGPHKSRQHGTLRIVAFSRLHPGKFNKFAVVLVMTEEATPDGSAEIQEAAHSAVTAASTEDAWTQLIGRADIDKAVAAAQPTSGGEGLPWSHEDA